MKKELEPVSTDLNAVNALMLTVDRQGRIVSFNKACKQTTGYSFNEVRGRYVWDLFLIPEEVEPFKAVCENLKDGSFSEYKYESYWVTKDGNRRRIAWSNSVILNNENAVEYIIGIGIDISEDQPWAEKLNQQNQGTQLLAKITLKIRQSLQLEDILETTVTEVRNLLEADRVLIYRFWPDGTGSGVNEAVVPGWSAVLGHTFEPEVLPQEYHQLYVSGRVRAIEDVENANISSCLVEFVQQFGVKAKLVVPIILQKKLWGLLIAHQCTRPRQWSSFEIELLKQLADQVSIALAQAQYQEHLEELVAERTAKLTNTLERLQREISERKRAEKALRESEERWRSLVKNAPDVIFTCDRQGKLLFINRTVPGFTVEQVVGTSAYDYIPPEHQDTLRQSFERVFQTGEPVYYETTGAGADGTTSWYASRVGAIQHEGQVVALMVIATDITSRKQAEELIHRREQELRALVENSPDMIVRFDPQLRHVYVNPSVERIAGIPRQTFIGKTNQDLGMPQELVACWDEALQDVLATGLERTLEFDFPTPSGIKSFHSRIVPEFTQGETIKFLLGVTRDITECKQAQTALRQWAERERAINQLVQAIRNSLDLETIFSTAVEEIGKLLSVDRVVIVQYLPQRKLWLNVADYRQRPDLPVALGLEIPDEGNEIAARLKRSEVVLIDDASRCDDEINRDFARTYPGAWLLVPLHLGSSVWGSLSFVVENRSYSWQESEVELSLAVAEQLAIAIQQAELLQQSCTATIKAQEQAAELESEIAARKRKEEQLRRSEAKFRSLAQREALLNRLANQIRRSLDLNTILETAVHEIRNLLQIDRCFFLWYRPDDANPVWEIVQEAKSPTFPSLIDYCVPVSTFGPLTERVLNKEITRVDSARTLTDPVERKFFFTIGYTALLALPIHTTSGQIGVVSCGHSSGARPWHDEEVELLRAVADQLAIAIDQAQLLHHSRSATARAKEQATQLEQTVRELQEAQAQLIQSEKMSSLGQLVAGVAHEINNPANFIYGNITYVNDYSEDLLELIQRYQQCYPQPNAEIQALAEEIDVDFIKEDLPKILTSMKMGTERISQIVLSLRNFSRLDEAEMKWVDVHEGLDSTLLILAHRLRSKHPEVPDIQVIKDYSNLPKVQCYPGQLNQVFMNILTNAIDAIEEGINRLTPEELTKHPGVIWICTEVLTDCNQAIILISDNGPGMTQEIQRRIFDPFFTTKPVGQGTGLGMSITYQIVVEKHGGQLQCISAPGQGAAFLISLPISQQND